MGTLRGAQWDHLFTVRRRDLDINFFSGTGAGGQHRNKHHNCVRIRHRASDASATGQSHRERRANIREALESLVEHPRFRLWQASRVKELSTGRTIEQIVEEQMSEENIKVEYKDESGRWYECEE